MNQIIRTRMEKYNSLHDELEGVGYRVYGMKVYKSFDNVWCPVADLCWHTDTKDWTLKWITEGGE